MDILGGKLELAGIVIVTGAILAVLIMVVIVIGTALWPDQKGVSDEQSRRSRKADVPAEAR